MKRWTRSRDMHAQQLSQTRTQSHNASDITHHGTQNALHSSHRRKPAHGSSGSSHEGDSWLRNFEGQARQPDLRPKAQSFSVEKLKSEDDVRGGGIFVPCFHSSSKPGCAPCFRGLFTHLDKPALENSSGG